jgi:hypothetical protein
VLTGTHQGRATPIEIGNLPENDFDHDFDFDFDFDRDTDLLRLENKNSLFPERRFLYESAGNA